MVRKGVDMGTDLMSTFNDLNKYAARSWFLIVDKEADLFRIWVFIVPYLSLLSCFNILFYSVYADLSCLYCHILL